MPHYSPAAKKRLMAKSKETDEQRRYRVGMSLFRSGLRRRTDNLRARNAEKILASYWKRRQFQEQFGTFVRSDSASEQVPE